MIDLVLLSETIVMCNLLNSFIIFRKRTFSDFNRHGNTVVGNEI